MTNHTRNRRLAVLLALLLLYSKEGLVTRTHYRTLSSPADLIHQSDTVLIVEGLSPFDDTRMVSILPPGSDYEGKNDPPYYNPPYRDAAPDDQLRNNYPPFQVNRWHVKVIDTLYTNDKDIEIAPFLFVEPGNTASKLSLYRRYYLQGHRKSPIYHRYQSQWPTQPETGQQFIVFLRQVDAQWELTIEDAIEGVEGLETIKELIAKKYTDDD